MCLWTGISILLPGIWVCARVCETATAFLFRIRVRTAAKVTSTFSNSQVAFPRRASACLQINGSNGTYLRNCRQCLVEKSDFEAMLYS